MEEVKNSLRRKFYPSRGGVGVQKLPVTKMGGRRHHQNKTNPSQKGVVIVIIKQLPRRKFTPHEEGWAFKNYPSRRGVVVVVKNCSTGGWVGIIRLEDIVHGVHERGMAVIKLANVVHGRWVVVVKLANILVHGRGVVVVKKTTRLKKSPLERRGGHHLAGKRGAWKRSGRR